MITSKYTVEDWQTGEMELHEIPEGVLSLSVEDLMNISIKELNSVNLNIIELVFACIFRNKGWRVVRTPLNPDRPVQGHLAKAIEQNIGIADALHDIGVPDLFLWNTDGEHRFVEVKASEDSLNRGVFRR